MSFGIPVRNGLGLGLLASTSLATGVVSSGPGPAGNNLVWGAGNYLIWDTDDGVPLRCGQSVVHQPVRLLDADCRHDAAGVHVADGGYADG